MPRVKHVKKARKPNPVVSQEDIDKANAGEEGAASYYHASFKTGPRSSMKRFWKKYPRASQLTLSEFWGAVYGLQEGVEDETWDFDELDDKRNDVASTLRDEIGEECRGKFDNMPEGLQQGGTGEMLEQRADSCESVADEIEGLDVPDEDEFNSEVVLDDDDDRDEKLAEWKAEKASEFKDEAASLLGDVEGG